MKAKAYLLIVLALSCFIKTKAQTFTEIPSVTAKLNYTFLSDNLNLAIVGGLEHYISTDQGITWNEIDNNVGTGLYQVEGLNIAVKDANIFYIVGNKSINNVVSKSTDGGNTWNIVHTVSMSEQLTDIAVNGDTVITSARNGVYRSTDGGISWNFIQLATNDLSSPFIAFNGQGNSWVVGNYATGIHVSTNGGTTWNEINTGFPSSEIVAASIAVNGVILSRNTTNESHFLMLNPQNQLDTLTIENRNLLFSPSGICKKTAFLPNNKLLTHDAGFFYIIDTTNQHVYHISHPYGNGYGPKSLSLGSSYGVAISYNSSMNPNTKLYRINLAQTPTVYVSSNFQIAGPGPCAGDNIQATAYANYADSVKWYVNNVLSSTSTQLNYSTPPSVYTTYTVQLNTYSQGLISTTTKTVTMVAPQPPNTFTYTVDTTACYGLPLNIFINPDGSPTNSAIKFLYNGQLVAGPYSYTSNNINAYTPPLTTSGVLQIITYKTPYCDPNADTLSLTITVGPNLLDFDVLENDTTLCWYVNPELSLIGTNSLYSYNFFATTNTNQVGFNYYQTPGSSSDTLEFTQNFYTSAFNNYSSSPYGPMYIYVHAEVTDLASSCTIDGVIDTFEVKRPTAIFEPHSHSFERSDTVHLSNALITENRLWSSPELDAAYIMNPTDTVPLIIADTIGFFGIKLKNEPLAGCLDSMTRYIHYADPAINLDSICTQKFINPSDVQHHIRIDQFGNIYEISVYSPFGVELIPLYIFRKMDTYGNLLWEKKATPSFAFGTLNGIAIEELDFDSEGNPVIAMWMSAKFTFEDDYFSFTTNSGVLKNECYVAKIDKNTGELIWRTSLNSLPNGEINSTLWRVTDVVVHNDLIYVATATAAKIAFFTLNSENGYYKHSSAINTPFYFLPNNTYLLSNYYTANFDRQSYWSPQIDALSSGELIAIGYYSNGLPGNGISIPELTLNNDISGIFAMKYDPENGIHDIEKIGQPGATTRPEMFVDKNDNIVLATSWQDEFQNPVNYFSHILDSIPPTDGGTLLLSMDKNYNLNWLTIGTHSVIEDLSYAESTGNIYLSCRSRDNFSIGNGTTHIMSGKDQSYEITYTGIPNLIEYHDWLNYPLLNGFITQFDENGKPQKIKKLDYALNTSEPVTIDGYYITGKTLKMDVTPCGDLALFMDQNNNNPVYVDGNIYSTDSTIAFFIYSNCTTDDCSYLNAPDSITLCSTNSSFEIQLSDYFNLDSLTYDVVVNGATILSNQSTLVEDGHFPINQPQGSTDGFTIHFNYPNEDTLVINYFIIPVDFGSAPTEPFCDTDPPFQLGNGTPAPGQYYGLGINGTQFYPTLVDPGEYTFIYFYNNQNGCIVSDTVVFTVNDCAGTDDLNVAQYDLYPNPFTHEFVIDSKQTTSQKETIVVYDQVGRIVYQTVLDAPKKVLNLESLANGNYLLEIKDQNRSLVRKRIVKANR